MADLESLDVLLHGEAIGTLTRLSGERSLFTFAQSYIDDTARATLSLSFKDEHGGLLADTQPTRVRLSPFFANLLPEGPLRDYLARRAGVNPAREFFLLTALGRDLPGALAVRPTDRFAVRESGLAEDDERAQVPAFHFSLAGVQLKFSALAESARGLTIPADGTGGKWIVKLPAARFDGVPENEYAMMTLAKHVGIDVPDIRLVPIGDIAGLPPEMGRAGTTAFAIKRFDRTPGGAAHVEDFAQVFGVYPEDKYKRASYKNIAAVVWAETGEAGVAEFARRLVFNTLIGNADMHLKNWSLMYPNRRDAALAPAYDFVSTIVYLPDDGMALNYARTRKFAEFSTDELSYLAAKARLPEKIVLDTAAETLGRFDAAWRSNKTELGLGKATIATIDKHLERIPLWTQRA